jgi:hypothetical protein
LTLRRSYRAQSDLDRDAAVHGHRDLLIPFVPTYQSIGIWGEVILTVLRTIRGIGVGGEWGGSVVLAMSGRAITASAAW